jgi:hypothetical protein
MKCVGGGGVIRNLTKTTSPGHSRVGDSPAKSATTSAADTYICCEKKESAFFDYLSCAHFICLLYFVLEYIACICIYLLLHYLTWGDAIVAQQINNLQRFYGIPCQMLNPLEDAC